MNYAPGFYATNYRGLRISEMLRMWGWLRFPFAFLITRFQQSDAVVWMPGLWADSECRREDLSDRFFSATESHRRVLEQLGFTVVGFSKAVRHLIPSSREGGGIKYLDPTRCHIGHLVYNRSYCRPPVNKEFEHVVVAYTAVFPNGTLSCTNNHLAFDPLQGHEVFRVKSPEPGPMYQTFRSRVASKKKHSSQSFPDLEALRNWWDKRQMELFKDRVDRGLFVRLTDEQVEAARRKLPPTLPKL